MSLLPILFHTYLCRISVGHLPIYGRLNWCQDSSRSLTRLSCFQPISSIFAIFFLQSLSIPSYHLISSLSHPHSLPHFSISSSHQSRLACFTPATLNNERSANSLIKMCANSRTEMSIKFLAFCSCIESFFACFFRSTHPSVTRVSSRTLLQYPRKIKKSLLNFCS